MQHRVPLDATYFRPSAIDPETAAFNTALEQQDARRPALYEVGLERLRAVQRTRTLAGPVVPSQIAHHRTIPGNGTSIPVRVLVAEKVRGVYLHFHGGGYVLGAAEHSDGRNEEIARRCEVAVVSVDYRRAPEFPYPAPVDDCEAAALWLIAQARAEFGTERLLIGGESAGATFSAVTLVRLRDRHGAMPFGAANLLYGNFDLVGTPSLRRWGDRRLVSDYRTSRWFHDSYAPPERQHEPDVSPLYAHLHGLPPALFTVGTLDPLVDDTLFMYARWVAAGNEADLAVYPGGVHTFDQFPLQIARDAHARIDRFIARSVSDDADQATASSAGQP